MSVPKSRRGESPAEYINLAREIYVFTYNRVRIAVNWSLRSPNSSNSNNFVNVNTDGTVNNNNANYSNGFAPGFYI